MSSYNSCCFGPDGIKYESFCQGWEEVSLLALKPKITSELSCIESTIENVLLDYVAALYALEEKVYGGEVVENVEDYFCVSFLQHIGVLSKSSIVCKLKKADIIWVA